MTITLPHYSGISSGCRKSKPARLAYRSCCPGLERILSLRPEMDIPALAGQFRQVEIAFNLHTGTMKFYWVLRYSRF